MTATESYLWSNDGTARFGIDVRNDVCQISQVFLANVLTIARQAHQKRTAQA